MVIFGCGPPVIAREHPVMLMAHCHLGILCVLNSVPGLIILYNFLQICKNQCTWVLFSVLSFIVLLTWACLWLNHTIPWWFASVYIYITCIWLSARPLFLFCDQLIYRVHVLMLGLALACSAKLWWSYNHQMLGDWLMFHAYVKLVLS